MTLTFGSLFAGVGGFDMGFEQAGWDCKFQVEWDKNCRSILDKHWPDVEKWGDIRNVNGRFLPPVDCIIFGSPCQDLSVAGKRAGLEGERSGLFHEAVRIIKEMRDATNGTFPRWTVWENVAGALSSNNGRDFGTVISEMAEAGACLQEYALLDAQHFGIPQRRRRVFLASCFAAATAERCPDPLLPVRESLPRDTKKSKPKRESAATTLTESVGASSGIVNAIGASIYHKSTVVNQDVNSGHLMVEGFTPSSFANYTEGVGTLRSNGGDLGGGSETLIAEPYVKSRRAQSVTDDETWVPGEVNPTLNSFDMGDTRATTAIVEPMLAFDTQFGSNANVFEDQSPTLKASQQSPSVAYPIHDQATRHAGKRGDKQDGKGNGLGIGNADDPMNTLTSGDRHAVAYDEYNDSINEVHHALRAGTKQSTGVLLENDVAATLRSGGSGGVPSSRGEHLVTEPTMAVRRLTPLECEKLMGWEPDHTRWKADGTEQADTHRYRQCGNGVATPVAKWVAEQIAKVEYAQG
jgi:DNA (cytosine-5)-methyltransferase 1